ncbi:unnamed protein product [Auanema sp. JU1783]|nr:unnamed protein product [Auanema sp. JU1783]
MRSIPSKTLPKPAATASPSVMLRRTGLLDKSDGGRVLSSPRSLRLAAPKSVVAQQILRRSEPRTQTPRRPRLVNASPVNQTAAVKKTPPKPKTITIIDDEAKEKLFLANEQLDATKEELQATLLELNEMRESLDNIREQYDSMVEVKKVLEEKNAEQAKELTEITNELIERRRKSTSRLMLGNLQNNEHLIEEIDVQDENLENIMLLQAQKKNSALNEELVATKKEFLKCKEEHKSLMKDMLLVVRVAQAQKEEAQAELARIQQKSKTNAECDEDVWTNLMKRFQSSSRRNSLLTWVQEVLMAYQPLSVTNFSSDWEDGKLFCALIHHCRPDLLNRMDLQGDCEDLAVSLAETLDVKAITPTLFHSSVPEWRQVMIAVFQLYKISQTLEH